MWVHNFITYDMSCEQVVVKIMIMVLLEKNYLLKKKKKKIQCSANSALILRKNPVSRQ